MSKLGQDLNPTPTVTPSATPTQATIAPTQTTQATVQAPTQAPTQATQAQATIAPTQTTTQAQPTIAPTQPTVRQIPDKSGTVGYIAPYSGWAVIKRNLMAGGPPESSCLIAKIPSLTVSPSQVKWREFCTLVLGADDRLYVRFIAKPLKGLSTACEPNDSLPDIRSLEQSSILCIDWRYPNVDFSFTTHHVNPKQVLKNNFQIHIKKSSCHPFSTILCFSVNQNDWLNWTPIARRIEQQLFFVEIPQKRIGPGCAPPSPKSRYVTMDPNLMVESKNTVGEVGTNAVSSTISKMYDDMNIVIKGIQHESFQLFTEIQTLTQETVLTGSTQELTLTTPMLTGPGPIQGPARSQILSAQTLSTQSPNAKRGDSKIYVLCPVTARAVPIVVTKRDLTTNFGTFDPEALLKFLRDIRKLQQLPTDMFLPPLGVMISKTDTIGFQKTKVISEWISSEKAQPLQQVIDSKASSYNLSLATSIAVAMNTLHNFGASNDQTDPYKFGDMDRSLDSDGKPLPVLFYHRDLNPSNILVHLESKILITQIGETQLKIWPLYQACSASPCYAAPEIDAMPNSNTPTELLQKLDVYSFGMVTWSIITGQTPFQGLQDHEIRACVSQGQRPTIPHHPLSKVVIACWAQDPHQRPTFDKILHMLKDV